MVIFDTKFSKKFTSSLEKVAKTLNSYGLTANFYLWKLRETRKKFTEEESQNG